MWLVHDIFLHVSLSLGFTFGLRDSVDFFKGVGIA